jgi:RNA polymerase sigma factor (sigma-70 family)
MAANPRQRTSTRAEGAKLSVQAARFYAQVYGSARAGCLNELRGAGCGEEEAEELFMASFERVMRTVDPIARDFAPAQMVNLMKTACRRRLIDERRHQGLIRQVDLAEVRSLSDVAAESPEELAEEREAVAIGREAVFSLPERDRLVFRQRYQMGLSPKEIQQNIPGLGSRYYRKIIERANARVLDAFEQIDGGERCQEMERVLLRHYIAGQASGQESQLVEAHLEHCRACQQAHARMRGYLHDVASSLAVAATLPSGGRSGLVADGLARLVGAFSDRRHALLEATRAARERAREALLRLAGALPGSGGDVPLGQAVGVSGVKIASACATGAAAVTCLAAGVVPGVGGIGLLGHSDAQRRPTSVRKAVPAMIERSLIDPVPARSAASAAAAKVPTLPRRQIERGSGSAGYTAPSSPSRATVSGWQTGTEFGFESGSAPAPSSATPAPSSSSTSSSGGGGATSHSGGGGSEFGL